jgi:hypothetical protein
MSYWSRAHYAAGGAGSYSVPFQYIDKSHVTVLDNGVAYVGTVSWSSSSILNLSPDISSGHTVDIWRTTPRTPLVTYAGGGLDSTSLNLGLTQSLYVSQEIEDAGYSGVGGGGGGGSSLWTSLVGIPVSVSLIGGLTPSASKVIEYTGSASAHLIGTPSGGAGGSSAWSALTGVPGDISGFAALTPAADQLPFFTDSAGNMAVAGLSAFSRSLFSGANAGAWLAALGVGAGSVQNMPNFVTAYSGVADGVTNNDAAFTSAEAGTYDRIWLPEGTFVTNKTRQNLKKTYVGPGRIKTSVSRWLAGFTSYDANTAFSGNTDYGQDSAVSKATEMGYHEVQPGTRKTATERYFYAPSTPKFTEMRNQGGWSGISGQLSAPASAGATSCTITGGVTGWVAGDTISFVDVAGGPYTDTKVLTSASGSTLTWSGGLARSYATGAVATHGIRTMNPYHLGIMEHNGGGDGYLWCGRLIGSYVPLPSQLTNFTFTSTVGLIGGDMVVQNTGCYGTGWEMSYGDGGIPGTSTGADVAIIGFVNHYERTNAAGAGQVPWMHDFVNSNPASQPIDGIWVAAQKAWVGLDLARSTISGAAIALATTQTIDFNSSISGPSHGNGFVSNLHGDSYITHGNDTTGFMDLWCGTSRLRLRDQTTGVGSFNCNVQFNCAVGVNAGNGGVSVSSTGGRYYLDNLGGTTYLTYNGATIQLVKLGSVVQSW